MRMETQTERDSVKERHTSTSAQYAAAEQAMMEATHAAELDAEQLRARVCALYEEDLLFAYRSLRAEYNRDVGRAPETRRPKRGDAAGGGGDWLDGVSEGEPE